MESTEVTIATDEHATQDSGAMSANIQHRNSPVGNGGANGAWQTAMKERIQGFRQLPVGWDGYDTDAANATAEFWAVEALDIIVKRNFIRPVRILPSVEGGIGMTFHEGDKSATIEFYNSGEIAAVTSKGQDEPTAWDVTPSTRNIENLLGRIQNFISKGN